MDWENANDPFYIPMLTPGLIPNLNVSNSEKTKLNELRGRGVFLLNP